VTELTCRWCDAGFELIGDYHYTRVGGMVFPLNKRCEKIHPPKPRPTHISAWFVPNVQCAECMGVIEFVPLAHTGPINLATTHVMGVCQKCDLRVKVPIERISLEVVE
jgi:hypothetical protein